ncbi:MAG TPA: hypothetical protein VGB62_01065 [Allosphingosinicella sp.]|jgi:hypothetical protein
MRIGFVVGLCTLALGVQPVAAQGREASAELLAGALDRCMVTYAVRLTKTEASDETIYAEADKGCRAVRDRLIAKIGQDYPADMAAEAAKAIEAQARPNFISLLARIRSDRAGRATGG